MMIGALDFGGTTFAWRQPQYQYWNRAAYDAAAAVPASGREGGASATVRGTEAAAPVSAQGSGVPAAPGAEGAVSGGEASIVFAPSELPYIPEGYGPEELATRTRIQFPGLGVPPEEWAEAQSRLPWEAEDAEKGEDVPGVEDAKSAADVAEDAKCKTCEERKYKDGSDDPGVSFKTATQVDPQAAQAAVRGHEMEHVFRERAKAEREGRKVVSQSVTYHTGICPECGKFYISGGTTRTVTAADNTADNMKDFLRKRFSGEAGDMGLDITA